MNFSELNLHPTVASALTKRGYETATAVQAAVLHPDAAGRDLLVSSQTGSGKTIAFGAALAENLLAPEAARTGTRTNPLSLVIVPTRELAVQVRDELGWLLRDTKLRLASFTGGTPVSGDLRTLQKGLDIAIGTPGRLVDLLRRQRLDLSDVRVVVLDEADEMLDLGFREDLQTLLQEAPESRRTLLLSATLPPEIQALARRFQRDALRIDPRKAGGPTAGGGHGDITYVAHLIAGADRLAVVVNILRAAGNGRAIVFCTTREGVSRLHAALTARGFAATAISGDRAQAERDRALEQVRKGDARVLVATNVAARGLHLPDVDLIVHADLPLNAESLTHRSGRTGRAGRKGTAVVLASLTERRKAERLLMSANVPVVWTAPPSPESITAAARAHLEDELLQAAGDEATDDRAPEDPAAEEMVERLERLVPARELARRLLLRELVHLPVGERIHAVAVPGPERRDRFAPARAPGGGGGGAGDDRDRDGRRPGRGDFAREGVMFRVNIGARDNADPRWLLPLICRRGGVTSRDVGAIRVGPQETVFEISGDVVSDFVLSSAERDPRAPQVVIEPMRPVPPSRPPDRAAPPATRKPAAAAPPAAAIPAATAPPTVASTGRHPRTEPPVATAELDKKRPTPPARGEKSRGDELPRREKPERIGKPPGPVLPAVARRSPPEAAAVPAQPASIFQTRAAAMATPPSPMRAQKDSAPLERAGRTATRAPIIEMKRAQRVEGNGVRRPAAAPATMAIATSTKATVPTAPPAASGAAGAGRPRRDDSQRREHGPRTDGTNPVRRSFNSPLSTFNSGVKPANRPAPGSPRPPFWKEGARKRPGPPPPRHPDSEAARGKPPRR